MEKEQKLDLKELCLGIELGSTRIKGVLVDHTGKIIAAGSHTWENQLEKGVWTYSLEDIWKGVQACYKDLKNHVQEQYGVIITTLGAVGISAMQHGYMAFDRQGRLLVPFRTWRNTMTEAACQILMDKFQYPIPQRWTIAHLYQAILNQESHVKNLDFVITLAGYVHWQLTGEKAVGLNEASGMFPVDETTLDFHAGMVETFMNLIRDQAYPWKLLDIFPRICTVEKTAGYLSRQGAALLDPEGDLQPGISFCPPEGDGGTGMVATNSIKPGTGHISAGTSVFSMLVLNKKLSRVYSEIDQVVTPEGKPVAMVHCNNCSSEVDAWIRLLGEAAEALGAAFDKNQLYETLYKKALEGDPDVGGLYICNYHSGEHTTSMEAGRPLMVRGAENPLTLANFMKGQLYSALATMSMGMEIILEKEQVQVKEIVGHGGLFKTEKTGQTIVANALGIPVRKMNTAGEGGAWGMALLASYMLFRKENMSVSEYLDTYIFRKDNGTVVFPDKENRKGFLSFLSRYKECMEIEKCAVRYFK